MADLMLPDLLGSYIRGRTIADQDAERKRKLQADADLRAAAPQVFADDPIAARVGQSDFHSALDLYTKRIMRKLDAESFGQPVEVMQGGQTGYAQFGNRGTVRPIEGYAPPPDSGSTPSDVATALWYANATPEERAAFEMTKRALPQYQVKDVNGVPTLIDPRIMPRGGMPAGVQQPSASPAGQPNAMPAPAPTGGRPGGLSTLESEEDAKRRLAAAQAAGAEQGKAGAQKEADRPKRIADGKYMLGLLRDIRNHPGLPMAVGKSSMVPVLPGTEAANFVSRLDQIGGRQFLEAFESLKGGGQITEVEGKKATQAIARMDRAQTEPAFKEAVDEFIGIVRGALYRVDPSAVDVPPAAIEKLRANPGLKDAFRAKYGFVPDGI